MIANYIIIFVIFIALCILYQRYLDKKSLLMDDIDYDVFKSHLLEESSLAKSKKPILWIHIPYEYNSRSWSSFGSRSSYDLNQPYLYLTVKSIIRQCDDSFNICLIDDNTFGKLLPNWKIDLNLLTQPMLNHVRKLGIANLIYNYGGINVPISFLCFRDLKGLYNSNQDSMFICENVNNNITSVHKDFYPDLNFMGANKNNQTVQELIDFMQRAISSDFTAQLDFLGDFDRWCNKRIQHGKIKLISGTQVGTKSLDDQQITVDILMGQDYINYYDNMYGIWIPAESITSRRYYEWFARLSPKQVLEANNILAKYFVLGTAPDSKEQFENKPEWIGFWKTPLITSWGAKPNNLGNNLKLEKYPDY